MSFDLKMLAGDIPLTQGDLTKVEGNEKVVQDILKCATTPFGSNPTFKSYGSLIANHLIGQPFDFSFGADMASTQIKKSIELLKNLQKIQAKNQIVTPAEQIVAVKEVLVERNPIDPRHWRVEISVITGEFKTASFGFSLSQS